MIYKRGSVEDPNPVNISCFLCGTGLPHTTDKSGVDLHHLMDGSDLFLQYRHGQSKLVENILVLPLEFGYLFACQGKVNIKIQSNRRLCFHLPSVGHTLRRDLLLIIKGGTHRENWLVAASNPILSSTSCHFSHCLYFNWQTRQFACS